jgi:hypothetical protein
MEEMIQEDVKKPCGCGRSPSGFCTGLHNMTEEEFEAYLMELFEDHGEE